MKTVRHTLCCLLLMGLVADHGCLSAPAAAPANTIILATSGDEKALISQQLTVVYREAFRRLGYAFTLEFHPHARALLDANAGRFDGAAGRVFDLNKNNDYPNLIRVEEPILELAFAAFAVNPAIRVQGWDDLKGKNWFVGYFRGVKFTERNIPLYVEEQYRVELTDPEEACRMLAAGRIDLFIEAMEAITPLLETRAEFRAIRNVGIVEKQPMYPYLHTKHQALAPQLAAALKAMKADGTYRQLMEQAAQQIQKEP